MKAWFCVGYKLNIAAQHRECLFFLFPFHMLMLLWLKILSSPLDSTDESLAKLGRNNLNLYWSFAVCPSLAEDVYSKACCVFQLFQLVWLKIMLHPSTKFVSPLSLSHRNTNIRLRISFVCYIFSYRRNTKKFKHSTVILPSLKEDILVQTLLL